MDAAPTITVRLPTPLRKYCGGASEVPLSALTVRTVLEELARTQPTLYPNICDETGTMRRHLNLFVNDDNSRDLNGLDTALKTGDVVTILMAVSGG